MRCGTVREMRLVLLLGGVSIATARAAKKHGLHMALSQLTTSHFEDVREAHPDGAKTLQLYVCGFVAGPAGLRRPKP